MGVWTIVVLAMVVVPVAAAAAVFAAKHAFALLGRLADRARPTADSQARPGHENLGVGMSCVIAPIIVSAFYDSGAVVAELLRSPEIWPAIALLVIYVVTPLSGVVAVLMWKNATLDWVGGGLSVTNLFGRVSPPANVSVVKMTPPLGGPGRVAFQVDDGWVFTNTSWINIRAVYEHARALGAAGEAWKEKATWADLWS